jgi:hypothetical protein
LQQFGVVAELGGRAGETDPAALHDVGLVGQAQGDGGELLDQQHAGAGFVDQHVLRRGDQGLGQHDHLLLAAGQGAGQRGQPLAELGEQLQDLLAAGLSLLSGQGVAGHAQVVLHGQVGQQAAALGDNRDAGLADPFRAPAGEISVVEQDGADLRAQDAADGQDQGRLTCAVRAEEGGDLAGRDLDRDVFDDRAAAALDGEIA